MEILVSKFDSCWVCGISQEKLDKCKPPKRIQKHHTIPQHLKPINNVLIPVCDNCHKRIHADDVNGMFSYLYKIQHIFKSNDRLLAKHIDDLNIFMRDYNAKTKKEMPSL